MDVTPKKAGFSKQRLEHITEHLERNYIAARKIAGCQVVVARHGRPAYFRSFGHMDIERGKPMTDDTIFRIYSMSKPITSVALMTLFEQGYFQLNDPVHRYIPEWRDLRVWVSGEGEHMETRPPQRPVSFTDLLSHTGGLTYGGALPGEVAQHPVDLAYRAAKVYRGEGETLRSLIEKLGTMPLRYEPGTQWMYSLSTDVCGYLVEATSGKPFDVYLQESIFDPLGMKDTAFSVTPDKVERFAANYQRGPDKQLALLDDPGQSTYLRQPTLPSGGGGLTSTTADYLRFCEMLREGGKVGNERIIGSRTLRRMTMNHLPDGKDLASMALGSFSETANEGVGFGLGFAMTLDERRTGSLGTGDYYWGGAASTIFWVDPAEDMVVIFMTQLMPSGTFNFRGQLKSIIYSAIEE